jgi:hypothetical protein
VKRRAVVANFSFHFQNNECGMKGCEEGKMMMLIFEVEGGSWHIMRR